MAWDPDKHPRDEKTGRFVSAGSLGKWAKTPKVSSKKQAQSAPKDSDSTPRVGLGKWAKAGTKQGTEKKAATPAKVKAPSSFAHARTLARKIKIDPGLSNQRARGALRVLKEIHPSAQAFLTRHPLGKISLSANSVFTRQVLKEKQPRGCNGVYGPKAEHLRINAARSDFVGEAFRPGKTFAVSKSGASPIEAAQRTLVHELAHHLHLDGARADIDPIVQKAYSDPKARPISRYGSTSAPEYFSESFAAYHFHKSDLKKHDPVGYRMIQHALKALERAK